MSTYNLTRTGRNNAGTNVRENFYQVMAEEIKMMFEENNIMMSKSIVQTIPNGTGADFDFMGTAKVQYHTPGTEINGEQILSARRKIYVDELLLASVSIAKIDEAMQNYSKRQGYAKEMANALAKRADIHIINNVAKAARSAATVTGGFGGTLIESDKFKIDAAAGSADIKGQSEEFYTALNEAKKIFLEKNVPADSWYVMVRPQLYMALAQNKDLHNELWGGNGTITEGNIIKLAGFQIFTTNHLGVLDQTKSQYRPSGISTDPLIANPEYFGGSSHLVDLSKTVALAWTPEAVGTVKLLDVELEEDYEVRYKSTLVTATYAMGHGVLRPECAIEFKLKTINNTPATY